MGILLAFLGMVSASPIETPRPTTPGDATCLGLGPRRNGFSDLPSHVSTYNWSQPWNAVTKFVIANDPDTGGDAIIYTQEEIYNAMQVYAIPKYEQPVPRANSVS